MIYRLYKVVFLILAWAAAAAAQTTINLQVTTGNDDGNQAGTTMDLSGNFFLGSEADDWGAGRFLSVTVPAGSTIDSASVEIYNRFDSNVIDLTIYGDDADDAAALTTTDNDLTDRTTTTATVEWDVGSTSADTWYTSPDIKSIIQEIVDRGGWASGNDIVILLETAGSNTAGFRSYDFDTSLAPKLNIIYSAGGGGSSGQVITTVISNE